MCAVQDNEALEAQEVAYQHIKKSIYNVQSLSRYHGLRAALGMLAFQVCTCLCYLEVSANSIVCKPAQHLSAVMGMHLQIDRHRLQKGTDCALCSARAFISRPCGGVNSCVHRTPATILRNFLRWQRMCDVLQAHRFQEHLLDDSTDIINRLIHMKTQHANKDVRERSDQALSAVFHQVAPSYPELCFQVCMNSSMHARPFYCVD